jgi:hypothetical protein
VRPAETGWWPWVVEGAIALAKTVGILLTADYVVGALNASGLSEAEAGLSLPMGPWEGIERELLGDELTEIQKAWTPKLQGPALAKFATMVKASQVALKNREMTVGQAEVLIDAIEDQARAFYSQQVAAAPAGQIVLQGEGLDLTVGDAEAPVSQAVAFVPALLLAAALAAGFFFFQRRR